MCGEHQSAHELSRCDVGSSPHVRGALLLGATVAELEGIIPACAGSTPCSSSRQMQTGDHPRMCGEHSTTNRLEGTFAGSSPHVRGALRRVRHRGEAPGIIPACAGSTLPESRCSALPWDHPRMCGEHKDRYHRYLPHEGSSPHVRGALYRLDYIGYGIGIIPACAGSTMKRVIAQCESRDHPRMCGEHLRGSQSNYVNVGIIPACAGSTTGTCRSCPSLRDHPRMCGEHLYSSKLIRCR